MSPAKPGEKSYDQLVKALTGHFNPTPSETVQRSHFNTRIRKTGESVATFVAELRSLAEHCNFGASLDDMLHDRIVCGINDRKTRQKLLSEKNLTLPSAIETTQAMETVAKDNKEMMQQENGQGAEGVHRVTPPRQGKDTRRVRSKFTGTCFLLWQGRPQTRHLPPEGCHMPGVWQEGSHPADLPSKEKACPSCRRGALR